MGGAPVSGNVAVGETVKLYFTKTFTAKTLENGAATNTAFVNGTTEIPSDPVPVTGEETELGINKERVMSTAGLPNDGAA